nr:immunoglobulin heavy chain junction region [Macaca mulatta]
CAGGDYRNFDYW